MSANFIYWANVLEKLKYLMSFVGLGIVLFEIYTRYNLDYAYDEEEKKKTIRNLKIGAISLIFIVMWLIFVPSKRTLIEMKVAEMLTKENYNFAKEEIKGAIDYIFEKIDEVAE